MVLQLNLLLVIGIFLEMFNELILYISMRYFQKKSIITHLCYKSIIKVFDSSVQPNKDVLLACFNTSRQFFRFVPESGRWLLNKGKVAKAMAILLKTAVVNKRQIVDQRDLTLSCDHADGTNDASIFQIFKSRALLVITLCSWFNW